MHAPPLRVAPSPPAERPAASRRLALISGALALACALLATLFGADAARKKVDIRAEADALTRRALQDGGAAPEVRARLREIRQGLSARPLDSRSRVVYAALLLGLGRSVDDLQAVRFHAELAARLAPVTVPVVRVSALLLARAGESREALRLTRRMFSYAPGPAARLLASLQPLVFPHELERGLPDDPQAWSAWFLTLQREGKDEQAERWLDLAHERWPAHLPVLQNLAARAVRRGDVDSLEALFPPGSKLPEVAEAAPVLAYRARLHAARGDESAARADLERAASLGGDAPSVKILIGEAYEAMGRTEQARRQWSEVLFALPSDATGTRLRVLVRLARLESAHGEPAVALRLWRSVQELDPEHDEARRRIRRLTGS